MSEDNFALPSETPIPFIEESFDYVDPLQVEKQLTEEFIDMQKNMRPEDVAAHFFQMYYPIYESLLSGLSNKDARRVAQHVVQWPLEDQDPKFHDEKAKQAFQVGIRLLDCKMIMKSVVEIERQANLAQQQAEQAKTTTEQPVAETQGEENGK